MVIGTVLITAIFLVQLTQIKPLQNQYVKAKADLRQAEQKQSQSQQIVSEPTTQQASINDSQTRVKNFISLVMNNKADTYAEDLKQLTTTKVINELSNTFAPSVTFSTVAHYDVPLVAVSQQWDSQGQFLVIAKSDVQSVAWQVTYDMTSQKVTDVTRLALKGAFDNEK